MQWNTFQRRLAVSGCGLDWAPRPSPDKAEKATEQVPLIPAGINAAQRMVQKCHKRPLDGL